MLVGPILAALPTGLAAALVTDGPRRVLACGATDVLQVAGTEAFGALDRLGAGWWAGFATYDLGRSVERVVPRAPDDLALPDVLFARFAAFATFEGRRVTLRGGGAARRHLEAALEAPRAPTHAPALGPWSSSLDRDAFETGVRTIVALVHEGACYQVNLARRLTCQRESDPLALWCALEAGNPAPHAAFLRLAGVTVVSASPERFLRVDGSRVETCPIKGTDVEADALRQSAKDHAENVMIVDLARNDLGRVCVPGSVHVPQLCALEEHPGLVHLVSTVRGELRAGVGLGALLAATFPPASVTGAPKPRVLQVIEDLEPVRRGVYCGAVGWCDTEARRADLSVAIRTFTTVGGTTSLGVGAGITADSDPAREWAETELKAARLLTLAGAPAAPRPAPVGVR